MEQDRDLSNHSGEQAEVYAARAHRVHTFDLRIAQDFSKHAGDTITPQFTLDFINFGNVLNSDWDVSINLFSADNGIQSYEGIDSNIIRGFLMVTEDNGDFLKEKTYSANQDSTECWYFQIAVHYFFYL